MADDHDTPPAMPGEIRLSSLTFTVERVKDLKDADGAKLYGECEPDEQWIRLNSANRGHEAQRLVLLHELVHVFENHAGLTLKESQVDSLARSIFSLIVDNPELLAWLTSSKPRRKVNVQPEENPRPLDS